jgi:methionine synthase II (cobalamin-independent)
VNALISIRKIANGYLVGTSDPYQNSILASQKSETFYPSTDALAGDFADILQRALSAAEHAEIAQQQAVADKRNWAEAQCAGARIGG